MQEAADELVMHMLRVALSLRTTGFGPLSSECVPDADLVAFILELGDVAARGGDPRALLFGTTAE